MSRLESFTRNAQAVVFTAGAAALQWLQNYVDTQLVPEQRISGIALQFAVIVLLFIFVMTTQSLVEAIVEGSSYLRHLVLGKDFVEGTWKNVVRHPDGIRLTGGIVVISMVNGKFRVRGETFDENGTRVGIFSSVIAEFDERDSTFRYTFIKTDVTSSKELWDGYSEYHFNTADRRRKIFDGMYMRKGDAQEHRLHGELVSSAERRKCGTEEGRKNVVLGYISQERRSIKAGSPA